MSNLLVHIADRVINRPLLILPDKLAILTEVLAGRIGVDAIAPMVNAHDPEVAEAVAQAMARRPDASRFVGDATETDANGRPARLPYRRTPEGVAVITITGSLVNRGAFIGASSGMTSYEGIAHQIESAARDPKVKSIVLDIESPGGEAVGAMETSALIRKVNGEKPVHAVVNGMAASAAYALASGAKSITSTESGLAGSIGVVLMHADYSRAIDRAGVTPTFIHAGAHKVDGNPYEPLSKEVRTDLQAEVDAFYDQFLNTVAAGRGRRLSAKAARATEARTYIGRAAQGAGLVDDIGSFADLVGNLSSSAKGRASNRSMKMFDQTDLDRARTEGQHAGVTEGNNVGRETGFKEGKAAGVAEGHKAGLAEGLATGAKAERGRIVAILGHGDAKGRETTAQHFALNTDMSLDAAVGALAGVPKTTSVAARAAATVLGEFPVETGEKSNTTNASLWKNAVDVVNKEEARNSGRR
jgi:signal peptide peptidase SppA